MPRIYHDDNFGVYDMEDEGDLEFYEMVQRESVWKICRGCEQRVKLRPDYDICNSCADKVEMGFDI